MGFSFAVLPENLWPRCVSYGTPPTHGLIWFTYVWCQYCKKEPAMFAEYLWIYNCIDVHMYVHKKTLFNENKDKPKLVTLCWMFVLVWKVVRRTCVESRLIHSFSSLEYENSTSRYSRVSSKIQVTHVFYVTTLVKGWFSRRV